MNIPTIIICIIILILAVLAARSIINSRKKGSGCGGSCSSCAMKDSCNSSKRP